MNDNISTVFDGLDEVSSRAECVVDDQGNTGFMGDLGNGLDVWDIVSRVANGLDIYGLGLVVDGSCKILRIVSVHKFGGYAKPGEEYFELIVCATVQVGRGDDVVSSMCQGCNCHELCRLKAKQRQSRSWGHAAGNRPGQMRQLQQRRHPPARQCASRRHRPWAAAD